MQKDVLGFFLNEQAVNVDVTQGRSKENENAEVKTQNW